jgi:uncharacterized membrane protein YgaE (UPF0421/DUF939 family)
LHLRRPTRASVELAAKAGLSAGLAIWLGNELGLKDSYWGAISAVVATAGTLGASVGAALSRISATIVGLLLGLAALALPVSGTVVSGATVFVALVVLRALSLDTGARLGAATTLIVTAIPGHHAVSDALARGANIPLGCAIAVGVGLVFFPHRAVEALRAQLTADVRRSGDLARGALTAYLNKTGLDDLPAALQALIRSSAARAGALRDAAQEPGSRGSRLLALEQTVAAVEALIDQIRSLVQVIDEADHDRAPSLIDRQLRDAAAGLADTAGTFGSDERAFLRGLVRLNDALSAVDTAVADVRARRATVDLATDELVRLFSVVRLLHASASTLSRLIPAAAAR